MTFTLEEMDRHFPTRRAECERAGLDAERGFIPVACLKNLTNDQRDFLFPSWRSVMADIRHDVDELAQQRAESGSA